jgi:hypothetical protein
MSINSREDANKYYQIVNALIDNYITKEKIKPQNLRRYLKNGSDKFEKFIERNGLKDINGIRQVINDVIDSWTHIENDGIMTFESYKLYESEEFKITSLIQCLYKGIGKTDINTEKFLADYFDTNLSHIDIVDSDRHIFKINDWENKDLIAIVYNNDELDIIKENIKEYLTGLLLNKKVDLLGLEVKLESIIDKTKAEEYIQSELGDKRITDLINNSLEQNYTKFNYKKTDKFHLWIKKA